MKKFIIAIALLQLTACGNSRLGEPCFNSKDCNSILFCQNKKCCL